MMWQFFADPTLAIARKNRLRLLIVLSAGTANIGPGSTTLAANYNDLFAQGYHWATVDGPYTSPARHDLRQILKRYSGEKKLELVGQLRLCYLVPGTIVQSTQKRTNAGVHK